MDRNNCSIRMKCDIVKQRKLTIEPRPILQSKQPRSSRTDRSGVKSAQYKLGSFILHLKFLRYKNCQHLCLVLPDQSTEVGDLIQPVPGVLYEDSRLKKGDPRRYQVDITNHFSKCLFPIYCFIVRLDSQNILFFMMVNVH